MLRPDGTVFSLQWICLPRSCRQDYDAQELFERYLRYLSWYTLGLVRPVQTAEGLVFRLRLPGTELLRFRPPLREHTGSASVLLLYCCAGLLSRAGEGAEATLRFEVDSRGSHPGLMMELAGYRPRLLGRPPFRFWRRCLYRCTQSALHQRLALDFLCRVYRELTGEAPPFRPEILPPEEGGRI